jgi:hypothetical protein
VAVALKRAAKAPPTPPPPPAPPKPPGPPLPPPPRPPFRMVPLPWSRPMRTWVGLKASVNAGPVRVASAATGDVGRATPRPKEKATLGRDAEPLPPPPAPGRPPTQPRTHTTAANGSTPEIPTGMEGSVQPHGSSSDKGGAEGWGTGNKTKQACWEGRVWLGGDWQCLPRRRDREHG